MECDFKGRCSRWSTVRITGVLSIYDACLMKNITVHLFAFVKFEDVFSQNMCW